MSQNNKKIAKPLKRKPTNDSDNDTSDTDSNASSDQEEEEEEEDEMSAHEYRKLLASLFPSKNAMDKVKAVEKLKKAVAVVDDGEKRAKNEAKNDKKKTKKDKEKEKKQKKAVVESDSSDDDDYVPSSEEEDDEGKYNIVFNIGGDEYDEEDSDDGEDTEDEDEPVSSDEEDEEDYGKKGQKGKKDKKKDVVAMTPADYEVLAKLNELAKSTNNNQIVQKCIDTCQQMVEQSKEKTNKKDKKVKDKHLRIFKKLLKDKNMDNDFEFYENMDADKQKRMIRFTSVKDVCDEVLVSCACSAGVALSVNAVRPTSPGQTPPPRRPSLPARRCTLQHRVVRCLCHPT